MAEGPFWAIKKILNSKYEIPAYRRQAKQAPMFKIQIFYKRLMYITYSLYLFEVP